MNTFSSMLRYGVFALTLWACLPASAQDKNNQRVVTVEKEYNPDVDNAARVNVLPERQLPTIQRREIEYGTHAGAYRDSRYQLGPDIVNQQQNATTRGYAQAGGGSHGQLELKAGYLFELTERSELDAAFSFGGTNSELDTRPVPENNSNSVKWDSHYYRTEGRVGFTHMFDEVTFNAGANAAVDNFNYYRFLSTPGTGWYQYLNRGESTNQGHRKFAVQAGIRSNAVTTLPIQFDINTSYSAFRRSRMTNGSPLTENLFHTVVDAYGDIATDQTLGLKLEMDNLFYSNIYSSYTALQVNPYYDFYYNDFKLHVGGKVHYNVGRGRFLQFAPDVLAEYPFLDGYSIYAELGGGHILNDFRRLELENPYWMSGSLRDSHQRINALAGVKGNVSRFFSFNVNAGYNYTKDDICFMNLFSNLTDIAYLYAVNAKTKHFFASAELGLHFSKIADIRLSGKTYDWDVKNSSYLVMKPKNEVGISADFRIIPTLKLNVSYNYIERNRATIEYFRLNSSTAWDLDMRSLNPDRLRSHAIETTHKKVKMDAVNNLSAGLVLDVLDNLSVYAQLNNILNKDYGYYYSYPVQGFSFVGGLSYRF